MHVLKVCQLLFVDADEEVLERQLSFDHRVQNTFLRRHESFSELRHLFQLLDELLLLNLFSLWEFLKLLKLQVAHRHHQLRILEVLFPRNLPDLRLLKQMVLDQVLLQVGIDKLV